MNGSGGGRPHRSTASPSSSSSTASPFRGARKSPAPAPSPAARPAGARPPSRLASSPTSATIHAADASKHKENVTVTVRFRPLSAREVNKGDEVAWYADGDNTVRNENNPSIAYCFDRVFGPATTTRHVYDVAAQEVVCGSMEGINGTVFAYGVTSSGKTHTMHGEQKSPGIIPLAVKDVFGIIQETPGREFLLRVSYLEIYNEVINDLLNPTGQNLRIREDAQGTYVEGIKEEVVLSPAHALSLIASGEEHRHVGSNNFNLLSSRSHTIFTLTIESSPCGEDHSEDVTLSQLHLIDLAGSESSKTETTGLRRKEGSYINKSLLTLGTVISKLTDAKAAHIPYRDSKLTRLLQSSLSGHGRVSLICTVTPASSNSEETHNTLKFAHRSKHVEIKASQNKIMDEKSLIKKYQKEISSLKEELQQLKRGMMENPNIAPTTEEDLVNLKMQLEAGQVKLQSRLEEEEEAKAALMVRIQRLTKLILVSTKNALPRSVSELPNHRRRHSFGEDELVYLPEKKREYVVDDDASYGTEIPVDVIDDVASLDELVKDYKRNRRRGMLSWFKLKKPEYVDGLSPSADSESSTSGSPASYSKSAQRVMFTEMKDGGRKSVSKSGAEPTIADSFPEKTQAGDLFSAAAGGRHLPPSGTTITDQMDLLREQVKMLAGEVALSTSSLKRLSEQAAVNPEDSQIREKMRKLKDEIGEKKLQIRILEQRMIGSFEMTPRRNNTELPQALSKLTTLLNEKTFELEIKSADNRILQEQLQMKISANNELQETILLLRRQLSSLSDKSSVGSGPVVDIASTSAHVYSDKLFEKNPLESQFTSCGEAYFDDNTPKSVMSLNRVLSLEDSKDVKNCTFNSQVYAQAAEIEDLMQDRARLTEEKDGLEVQNQKLAEEAAYAKELAGAAAVELRNLAEEVTKLSYENAKLTSELATSKEGQCRSACCQSPTLYHFKQNALNRGRSDGHPKKQEDGMGIEELQKELSARYLKEAALEKSLSERDKIEDDLRRKLDEAEKQKEDSENELANLRVLTDKLLKASNSPKNVPFGLTHNGFIPSNGHSDLFKEDELQQNTDKTGALEELKASYQKEKKRCKELENYISRLKGDDIAGLDITTLEEMQNLHVDAITKICHAKCANRLL